MKVTKENIGLLCSSNGQGHSGGLEFHLKGSLPINSGPRNLKRILFKVFHAHITAGL